MKAIFQDKFGPVNGNCFAACVASLLELPLEDVPNFCQGVKKGDTDWWDKYMEWLGERGYSSVGIKTEYDWRPNEGQECFLIGKSPRGDFNHAVAGVFKDGEYQITHDPHPSGDGLNGGPETAEFLFQLTILGKKD